ncbi:MAG: hypothetical protein GQF41_1055 [Candidatus Rifleibacterium amylolyticum]|nr:MAG: hypothetical protein GQF41_1055 [Candidatus Rifleibacterium amylolyticum]
MENVSEIHTTAADGSKAANSSTYWVISAIESCNTEYSEVRRALGFIHDKMLTDDILCRADKEEAERFFTYQILIEGIVMKMIELERRFSAETEKRLSDLRAGNPRSLT